MGTTGSNYTLLTDADGIVRVCHRSGRNMLVSCSLCIFKSEPALTPLVSAGM